MMQWLRLYHCFLDDPKIAMMSDSDQLLWIKALILASESSDRGKILLTDDEICWRLRISPEVWRHAIDKFRAKGMIEHCQCGYLITNWHKRQFDSDDVSKRVAKLRGKNKPTEQPATKKPTKAQKPEKPSTDLRNVSCNVTGNGLDQNRSEKIRSETDSYSDPDQSGPVDQSEREFSIANQPTGQTSVGNAIGCAIANQPAAIAHSPTPDPYFGRTRAPVSIQVAQTFQGPWGIGCTEEQQEFDKWLQKQAVEQGKSNPAGYAFKIIDSIAKGGPRGKWDEFTSWKVGRLSDRETAALEQEWAIQIHSLFRCGKGKEEFYRVNGRIDQARSDFYWDYIERLEAAGGSVFDEETLYER